MMFFQDNLVVKDSSVLSISHINKYKSTFLYLTLSHRSLDITHTHIYIYIYIYIYKAHDAGFCEIIE